MSATNPEEYRMSLGDHLEELRTRLLLGIIGPILFMLVLLLFADKIVVFLCKPLLVAQEAVGEEPKIYVTNVLEAFGAYLRVAFVGGLILGIPWLTWHLWKFIAPGLYASERRFVTSLIPGSIVLASLGVAFMYYVILPISLWFLIGFVGSYAFPDLTPSIVQQQFIQTPEKITTTVEPPGSVAVLSQDPAAPAAGQFWLKVPENQLKVFTGDSTLMVKLTAPKLMSTVIKLGDYISFVMMMALAFAVVFQTPLVMLMLAWTGIVDYGALRRGWRWALLASVVIGAIISPTGDPMSLLAFAAPLYLLYELGLIAIRLFVRKKDTGEADGDNLPGNA
jgi:sec-independent protein translocase protein TatC